MSGKKGKFNQPVSAFDMPRAGGIATMFRLPYQENSDGLDACIVGVPFDNGSTNRSGSRFGPRQIRSESVLLRGYGQDTGAAPYESLNVADIGDINFNMFDIQQAVNEISAAYSKIIAKGCKVMTLGGDHTISYPILQAIKKKYGPVGLIHVDAHPDTNDTYNGAKITHGSTFRRAVEEDLLDLKRVVQIGLRGSGFSDFDATWGIKQGFRVVPAHDCWHKSMVPLMEDVLQQMGTGPVYISFDIDGIDPAHCPGTGTPEIAGLTSIQALEIIRGCRGLNIVGADIVEVSPPYDRENITSLTAANLMFELMCVLPGVKYHQKAVEECHIDKDVDGDGIPDISYYQCTSRQLQDWGLTYHPRTVPTMEKPPGK